LFKSIFQVISLSELDDLYNAILSQDVEGAEAAAKACVVAKVDPIKAMNTASEAIKKIGDLFDRAEIFLPEVIVSAEAMKKASAVLLKDIPKERQQKKAKFVIGTVEGDVHDIGKGIVATLLDAEGFDVIDLGRDVATSKFVEVVRTHSPSFVGLSALMTVTATTQGAVIKALKEAGLRDKVKVMVGGGATTEFHAEEIGADGWGADALDAVAKAKSFLKEED
jgi:corrinoid protein of di/trimethylamine methyltransferase